MKSAIFLGADDILPLESGLIRSRALRSIKVAEGAEVKLVLLRILLLLARQGNPLEASSGNAKLSPIVVRYKSFPMVGYPMPPMSEGIRLPAIEPAAAGKDQRKSACSIEGWQCRINSLFSRHT